LDKPRRLILSNLRAPGDIVMLTVAVRDLHRRYPGKFVTDVRTHFPDLWLNNPYVSPLQEDDPGVEKVECEYPLIYTSNQRPYHFVHSFVHFLNKKLGLSVEVTEFKGDIHLAEEEKEWIGFEGLEKPRPFWIIVAGGKLDFTVKWWDYSRYQDVVDHYRGKIEFVQVGSDPMLHPPLRGVVDLRGKTTVRELIRLMHHAQGVLTPVSFPMHLAAAVPCLPGGLPIRPCVVVAGGRELAHWVAYPNHQFIHTNGQLPCCFTGGCWRSRVHPLGDGAENDIPEQICLDVVDEKLPRCMDMIATEEVIRRIEGYFAGGSLNYV
jgi:ADP-heptose:LPS heptosyltransferase